MSEIVLHTQDIVKTFGSGDGVVRALNGVTLDVYKGELLMLVGPSGCGKTTFVSIITSLLSYDSGICEVLGSDISKMSEDKKVLFRGKSIGFVFQSFNLLSSLTALENVALPLTIAGVKRGEALSRANELLSNVDLSEKANEKPSNLSGGQQQRVAIARALIHNPDLIICDEPTSSLDHKSGQVVMELLKKMTKEKGKTMIVVTHDNRIYEYGNRMAYMEDGKIFKIEKVA
jgi:putative ABC transport system ATP-binding protein